MTLVLDAPATRSVQPRTLALTLVALTWFDAIATYLEIKHLGAMEGNPFLAHIQALYGAEAMCAFRGVFGTACAALLHWVARESRTASQRRFATAALWVGVAVLSLVAVYHVVGSTYIAGTN